jgi:hypothetical protein
VRALEPFWTLCRVLDFPSCASARGSVACPSFRTCLRLRAVSCCPIRVQLLRVPLVSLCKARRLLALLVAGSGTLSTLSPRAVRLRRLPCSDDVLAMGIDKYNAECRSIVTRYCAEWEVIVGVRALTLRESRVRWVGGRRLGGTRAALFVRASLG